MKAQSVNFISGMSVALSLALVIVGCANAGDRQQTRATSSTAGGLSSSIVNGDFETGTLAGWTVTGTASITNWFVHGGNYAAVIGSTSMEIGGYNSLAQSFTAPTAETLSFWYRAACWGGSEWAQATLTDNTNGTTTSLLPEPCTSAWTQVTTSLVGGHAYTLTVTSHDPGHSGDVVYAALDDVTLSAPLPPPTATLTVTVPDGTFSNFDPTSGSDWSTTSTIQLWDPSGVLVGTVTPGVPITLAPGDQYCLDLYTYDGWIPKYQDRSCFNLAAGDNSVQSLAVVDITVNDTYLQQVNLERRITEFPYALNLSRFNSVGSYRYLVFPGDFFVAFVEADGNVAYQPSFTVAPGGTQSITF